MSWGDFLFIYLWILVAILAFRCIPMFALKGSSLPEGVSRVLDLIPAATFAALVANDLCSQTVMDEGISALAVPLAAALVVVLVARRSRSLVWSIVAGIGAYAVFALIL
jgi:branched-subunit amino acid transport protein